MMTKTRYLHAYQVGPRLIRRLSASSHKFDKSGEKKIPLLEKKMSKREINILKSENQLIFYFQ